MNNQWVKKWTVASFTSNRFYTVAVDKFGNYACSCPRGKYKREQCKHIQHVIDSQMKPDEEVNNE